MKGWRAWGWVVFDLGIIAGVIAAYVLAMYWMTV